MIFGIIAGFIIYLFLPIIGLICFFKIKNKMIVEGIKNQPILEIFVHFVTYGGLLLVVLTSLFLKWSVLASLGTFYLIIGAPIIMGIVIYKQAKNKELSKYHYWTYNLSVLYFLTAPLTFLGLFLLD
ncbi:hypothetical protein ACFX5E_01785 [Flavobacterium sp. LS2P90]|uniref:DUF4345 domain-containing protein n=1 Tax=Flavobacterium xylosi TaxID=3230415 RepID=A0ABW6HS40_9FLAO